MWAPPGCPRACCSAPTLSQHPSTRFLKAWIPCSAGHPQRPSGHPQRPWNVTSLSAGAPRQPQAWAPLQALQGPWIPEEISRRSPSAPSHTHTAPAVPHLQIRNVGCLIAPVPGPTHPKPRRGGDGGIRGLAMGGGVTQAPQLRAARSCWGGSDITAGGGAARLPPTPGASGSAFMAAQGSWNPKGGREEGEEMGPRAAGLESPSPSSAAPPPLPPVAVVATCRLLRLLWLRPPPAEREHEVDYNARGAPRH